MKRIARAARWPLIVVLGIVAGYLLLVGAYLLPVEPMARNVRASVPALNGEWGQEDAYEQLIRGYVPTQLDNSTDAVMMLAAVHESEKSPFVQAAEGCNYGGDSTSFAALMAYAQGEALDSVAVARYWHGYLVLLKPLLLGMSYLDIRMLLMLVQGALLLAVVAGLCRRRLGFLVPAFGVSLIFITPSVTGFSLQFSTSLCTLLAAMIALLYLPRKRLQQNGLQRLFLITGMVVCYVDYLTYPIATLGMPLCLCPFLLEQKDGKAQLRCFASCCLCWAAGYFGMWAGKWVIAGLLSDEPWFWANLVAKIRQRSAGESDQTAISYLDVLVSQLRPFAKRAYLLAFAALAAGWLLALWLRRRQPSQPFHKAERLVLALTALLPFAWYFFTQNHSFNHAFFTSRALSVSAFAAGCLLMMPLKRK